MLRASLWNCFVLATLVIIAIQLPLSACINIGVNYGRNGDNLPSPKAVVSLYKKYGIQLMKVFDPNHDVLEALRGSNLQVSLGVRNEDVQSLASCQDAANKWVNSNVAPYKADVNFQWITVGNEIIPGTNAPYVPQAMKNIYNALNSIGLNGTKVTTPISMHAIAVSYPPSAGQFISEIESVMMDVTSFLHKTGAPLMVNLYPYFAYASDPSHISFGYATFNGTDPVEDNGLKYFSLFDAMVDAVYAALEKIGAGNVHLIVGETGWPSAGSEPYTSKSNAHVYSNNMINHLRSHRGTPRRPFLALDVFIFAMFNENLKGSAVERNWGLFNPDMSPVYPLLECTRNEARLNRSNFLNFAWLIVSFIIIIKPAASFV